MARAILHVDMDAFYASVEEHDDPSLRGKPVVVGGRSRRGVVLAASYAVRPFGVRSAMPMVEALRLCPRLVVVPPRHHRYAEVSHEVFEVFRTYTPLVEGLSVDEAFLDVTASRSLFGDPRSIAEKIRADVKRATGLVASVGVATSKFVAKIASDLKKPDALVVVPEGEEAAFLAPLPIERMWGVGPKTAPRMRALGLRTIGDLARSDPAFLERVLGSWGPEARMLARGQDERDVEPDRAAKSIGAEETYERDLVSREEIERSLLGHAERIAQRLHADGLRARTITIKIKYTDFVVRTRQLTLDEPVADTASIFAAARALLDRVALDRAVRLTGISAGDPVDGEVQATLFPDEAAARRRKVEGVLADVKARLGTSVTRAELLDRPERVAGASLHARDGEK